MTKNPIYKKFKDYEFEHIGEFKFSLDNYKSTKYPKPLKINYTCSSMSHKTGVYIFEGYKKNPIYIGQSSRFPDRLNDYLYSNPIRSAHEIDTTTDIHCKIYSYLKKGKSINIYFLSTLDYKKIEKELIDQYYPDEWWNLSH